MEDNYLRGLGLLVTLLVLLAARRRKKEAEARDADPREYVPIEPETSNLGTKIYNTLTGVMRAYAFLLGSAIVAAVLIASIFEPLTRWIILGTAAVLLLIFLANKSKQAEATPEFNPDDPWED